MVWCVPRKEATGEVTEWHMGLGGRKGLFEEVSCEPTPRGQEEAALP